jgi:hypothetical protein
MNDLCKHKHERVDEILDNHDSRLNDHDRRIDLLEQFQSRSEVQIMNLCKEIESLVSTIKWSMGLLITTLLGFFIWYIQNL